MKKTTFKNELEKRISILTLAERQRILTFYEETIEDSMEDGMSEEEAVANLGDMDSIVKDILLENHIVSPDKKEKLFAGMDAKWRYLLLFLTSPLWFSVGIIACAGAFCIYLLIAVGYFLIGCLLFMPALFAFSAVVVIPFQLFQNFQYCVFIFGLGLCGLGGSIYVAMEIKGWFQSFTKKAEAFHHWLTSSIHVLKEKVVY